jgi:hypothetical protein
MSLSAVSSYQPSGGLPGSLVPTLPSENAVTAAEASKATAGGAEGKHLTMFAEGDDEPSFWDFLDVINPLQHIPIVNNLYREVTGDKIGVAARLAGGALFGLGPLGLVAAAANCVLEESTGRDTGGHMLALLRDDEPAETGTGTALAAAEVSAPAAVSQAAPQALAAEAAETPKAAEAVAAADAKPAPASASTSASASAPASGDATAKAQPLVMDLMGGDGSSAPAAARPVPVAAATAAPAAETAQQQVAAAANRPMSLGREPRFMPLPGRNTPLATRSPPAVSTTISNTGYRSNAPVAGHRPDAQRGASAAMGQQMVAAQAESSAMSQGQGGMAQSGGDWFSASMMQAMDKYEKSSRLNRQASSGTVTEQ